MPAAASADMSTAAASARPPRRAVPKHRRDRPTAAVASSLALSRWSCEQNRLRCRFSGSRRSTTCLPKERRIAAQRGRSFMPSATRKANSGTFRPTSARTARTSSARARPSARARRDRGAGGDGCGRLGPSSSLAGPSATLIPGRNQQQATRRASKAIRAVHVLDRGGRMHEGSRRHGTHQIGDGGTRGRLAVVVAVIIPTAPPATAEEIEGGYEAIIAKVGVIGLEGGLEPGERFDVSRLEAARISDVGASRTPIQQKNAPTRLRGLHLDDDDQSIVLPELAGTAGRAGKLDLAAVEIIVGALDAEALGDGWLRRQRRADDRDDGIDTRFAPIADHDAVARQLGRRQPAQQRALMRSVADGKRDALGFLAERMRRQQHPRLLLGGGGGPIGVSLGKDVDEPGHGWLGHARFGDQGQQGGAVAHAAAIVAAAGAIVAGANPLQGRFEGTLGAGPVAQHRQRGAELGLRQGCGKGLELGIDVVSKLPDGRAAVTGQHVKGIGAPFTALFKVLGVTDEVLQAVEGSAEGLLRQGVAGLLGAGEKVGDVAAEPDVAVERSPNAEGAGTVLQFEHAGNGRLDALADLAIAGKTDAL